MTSALSLRSLLRQSTASAHLALEATPLMRAMSGGAPSANQYLDYLHKQLQLHAVLEVALRPWLPPEWCELRLVKAQWLRGDLLELGDMVTPGDTSDAVESHAGPGESAPRIACEAEALGTLYVLEGGTLGLQVVRKRIQAGHPGEAMASRFLVGYGIETGPLWRTFVDKLEGLPVSAWPAAVHSACATFNAFHRRFESTSP